MAEDNTPPLSAMVLNVVNTLQVLGDKLKKLEDAHADDEKKKKCMDALRQTSAYLGNISGATALIEAEIKAYHAKEVEALRGRIASDERHANVVTQFGANLLEMTKKQNEALINLNATVPAKPVRAIEATPSKDTRPICKKCKGRSRCRDGTACGSKDVCKTKKGHSRCHCTDEEFTGGAAAAKTSA
jgi:hypothetical protein